MPTGVAETIDESRNFLPGVVCRPRDNEHRGYHRGILQSEKEASDAGETRHQSAVGLSGDGAAPPGGTGVNVVHQTLQTSLQQAHADAAASRSAVDAWRAALAAINGRIDHLNAVEGRMLELQRKLDVATQDYTTYLGRAEAAKISDDLNNARITSVAVVQQPTLPPKPARPKTKLILAVAVFVGLVAGASCCLLLELYDDRVSLYPQFDELAGLPILAALPLNKTPALIR